MKKSLLRSFLELFVFYTSIALFLWFSSDELIQNSANQILEEEIEVSPLNSLPIAIEILDKTLPSVLLIALFLAFGLGVGIVVAIKLYGQKKYFADSYRGVNVNIGNPLRPTWELSPKTSVDLELVTEEEKQGWERLEQTHKDFALEVIALLQDYPEIEAGYGHDTSLLEHSLTNFFTALSSDEFDPLLPLIALTHDLGKIFTFSTKNLPDSLSQYKHDRLSGLIASALDSFEKLDIDEQKLINRIIKFSHKPSLRPSFMEEHLEERSKKLATLQRQIDHSVTNEEQQDSIKEFSFTEFLDQNLLSIIGSITFQRWGLPKGTRAGGWRSESKLYILEHILRSKLEEILPDSFVAANKPPTQAKFTLSPLTKQLLKYLKKKNWLAHPEGFPKRGIPLWNLRAGSLCFKAVVAIELPKELSFSFPDESPYPIKITERTLNPRSKVSSKSVPSPKPKTSILEAIAQCNSNLSSSSTLLDQEQIKNARSLAANLGIPLNAIKP